MIIMDWSKASNSEDDDLGTKVDVGDYYFTYNNTSEYFPVLKYNTDHVPFGSAATYCVHL